jgi:hypothetical protein
MPLHIYRRFPIQLYYLVYVCGGFVGLQYVLPSRLYALSTRILLFVFLWLTWYFFVQFHLSEQFLYRELCLLTQLFHYLLSLLYLWCFGSESLLLLSSDIKEKKIELLRRWQESKQWKSTLQV